MEIQMTCNWMYIGFRTAIPFRVFAYMAYLTNEFTGFSVEQVTMSFGARSIRYQNAIIQ